MRLSIDLNEQQHQAIKAYAALNGMTIKDFVIARVFTEDMKVFNEKTQKVLSDSQAGEGLTRYKDLNDFMADMDGHS